MRNPLNYIRLLALVVAIAFAVLFVQKVLI